ncbi:MAG: hypothetical protein RL687_470 [Candidatus Parcubacteria bacterium]|jgi:peptidoglycan/xylan/chitin deacetylase (PgdA/CDA1 family)
MTITIKRKYKYPIYFLISLIIIIPIIYTIISIREIEAPKDAQIKSENKINNNEPIPLQEIVSTETYKITKDFTIVPINPDADKKIVLLTIDDGPSSQSDDIVRILSEQNVKAIFFINGMNHKAHSDIIKKEFEAGHAIGNHTWSHQNLKKITEEKAKKEIESNSILIEKETSQKPIFFRAPYGILSPYAKQYIDEQGMMAFNWSSSSLDWEKKSKDKKIFIENITKNLKPGSIILMHEHTWSRDALPDLITAIKEKGYTFINPKNIVK